MLITFVLLGKYLEASAKGKASEAMSELLSLQPPTALQCEGCWESEAPPREVPASTLRRGDVVKILPGAQVPVDVAWPLHGRYMAFHGAQVPVTLHGRYTAVTRPLHGRYTAVTRRSIRCPWTASCCAASRASTRRW